MKCAGLIFEREKEMDIFYKEHKVGTRRIDFFVNNTIMVEIKAISGLEDTHIAQIKNYLEAYNLQIGLLLNFGQAKLEFKRESTTIKSEPGFMGSKGFSG
ncbi:MAG TPA: GxxExxY protein [Vampirovibrionales bacterium]